MRATQSSPTGGMVGMMCMGPGMCAMMSMGTQPMGNDQQQMQSQHSWHQQQSHQQQVYQPQVEEQMREQMQRQMQVMPMQPMLAQHMPAQQMSAQQMPAQQMPANQMPVQQMPMQQPLHLQPSLQPMHSQYQQLAPQQQMQEQHLRAQGDLPSYAGRQQEWMHASHGSQQMQMMPQMGSVVFVPVMVPMSHMSGSSQPYGKQMCSQASSKDDSPSPTMSCLTSVCQSRSPSGGFFSSTWSNVTDGTRSPTISEDSSPIACTGEVLAEATKAAAAQGASHAEIFEELFDAVSRKDQAAMLRHRHRHWAPDCEMHWLDTGFVLYGLQEITATDAQLLDGMSDFNAMLQEVNDTGHGEVDVHLQISGTQANPFLPLFPTARFVKWDVMMHASFNPCGKVRRMSISVGPVPELGLELGNLEGIAESALALAMTPSGSRLLQLAIQSATTSIQETIIARLQGNIWDVAASPHGNHVLQKYIATAPTASAMFIASELRGRAVAAAQHNTRSRVLERLLEHCIPEQVAHLVEELVGSAVTLCRDSFGNFVMQRLFEHSSPEHRHRAALEIVPHVCKLARHRQANNVVRAAIAHCAQDDRVLLAETLMADRRGFAGLAKHIVGSFVARELRLAGLVG